MSRCFSITSRISDATMFSAATITIRPIVIEMAIFSSHSAEKSDRFICAQSCVRYSPAKRSPISPRHLRRQVDVVHAQLDQLGVVAARSAAPPASSDTNP